MYRARISRRSCFKCFEFDGHTLRSAHQKENKLNDQLPLKTDNKLCVAILFGRTPCCVYSHQSVFFVRCSNFKNRINFTNLTMYHTITCSIPSKQGRVESSQLYAINQGAYHPEIRYSQLAAIALRARLTFKAVTHSLGKFHSTVHTIRCRSLVWFDQVLFIRNIFWDSCAVPP